MYKREAKDSSADVNTANNARVHPHKDTVFLEYYIHIELLQIFSQDT